MGYSKRQIAALARTIKREPADVVVAATPIDLKSLAGIDKPVMRARYEYAEPESPGLTGVVEAFVSSFMLSGLRRIKRAKIARSREDVK
jgi:predicted GTPase